MGSPRKRTWNLIWRHGEKYGWQFWRWFWRQEGPGWPAFLAVVVIVSSVTLISFWGSRLPLLEPMAVVSVSGTEGLPFSGFIENRNERRSVEGAIPATFMMPCDGSVRVHIQKEVALGRLSVRMACDHCRFEARGLSLTPLTTPSTTEPYGLVSYKRTCLDLRGEALSGGGWPPDPIPSK